MFFSPICFDTIIFSNCVFFSYSRLKEILLVWLPTNQSRNWFLPFIILSQKRKKKILTWEYLVYFFLLYDVDINPLYSSAKSFSWFKYNSWQERVSSKWLLDMEWDQLETSHSFLDIQLRDQYIYFYIIFSIYDFKRFFFIHEY